jgi:mono/diheme cytochrome c family protein
MIWIRAALLLGTLVLLAPPLAAQEAALAAAGSEYYAQYCAACHGISGKGDGPAAPALITPPPDLTALSKRYGEPFPGLLVAKNIDGSVGVAAHGSTEMPVWGRRFRREEAGPDSALRGRILLLVEYLRSIQKP